eukprot:3820520-Ditylum_brightwellii.AAC.2
MYPEHVEALLADELEPVEFLTLDKIWERETLSKIRIKQKHHDNQRTFLVIGYSSFLQKTKIPHLLCKLKKQYNLPWLQVSLAYWRFPNIQENFSGNLS